MKSVFQKCKECYVCGSCNSVQEHHIFFGNPSRKHSEKRGLKVFLCLEHHTGGQGVHFNKLLDIKLKHMGQEYYERIYGTRRDFVEEFGQSYL